MSGKRKTAPSKPSDIITILNRQELKKTPGQPNRPIEDSLSRQDIETITKNEEVSLKTATLTLNM